MQEDEIVGEFSGKLRDIANKAYQLGEEFSKGKLVQKTLRTRKTSKPQGRFKTDNSYRKGPNKFKFERSTMKRKFDTGKKGKGIQYKESERYGHIQAKCANTLKKNRSMNTNFNGDDKKSDSEDDEEDTDHNETLAFNMIIDLKIYLCTLITKITVTMIPSIIMKNLLCTKWVGLVKLHQDLKDDLKKIQEQKDALEERNYELIAQVKDATERVNIAEAGMKSVLGYTGTNLNHTTGTHVTQHGSSYATFGKLEGVFVKDSLSQAEKRNLIKKQKPRKPPLMCDYCKMIGNQKDLKSINSFSFSRPIIDGRPRPTIGDRSESQNKFGLEPYNGRVDGPLINLLRRSPIKEHK
ncbi:hypothetical protein M9H77_07989 [Catharanthus roseus]|uniref:Uncharacterized protein n=1 Tax=Catharanthus roseus TaxID=4058 RepID=A0ACC0BWS9_CATRO|nr:hypothetical protein M9H77_07989 [Catharanthus roseus]